MKKTKIYGLVCAGLLFSLAVGSIYAEWKYANDPVSQISNNHSLYFLWDERSYAIDITPPSSGGGSTTPQEEELYAYFQGTSSDNPSCLFDRSISYSGSDTTQRWTNWSSDHSLRGSVCEITIFTSKNVTFDEIKLFHFVDSGGCDLPQMIEIQYKDLNTGTFNSFSKATLLGTTGPTVTYNVDSAFSDITMSKNWTNPYRNTTGYYVMDINGTVITYDVFGYKTAPCTSFVKTSSVTTNAIKIILDGIDAEGSSNGLGYFVGLIEIEMLLDDVLITFNV